ncbi:MAG: uridine kinase [Ruminococcaceae bacterium]|nr:uridine kinase [Oscillospiraceae bacterium]
MIIAIDGPCCGGKTTYANKLAADFNVSCNIFHMDDFFLRPEQRTEERINTPGENVDYERFLEEVLIPLKSNSAFSYRKFSCSKMDLDEYVCVEPREINIIEGTYSLHPALRNYYDKCIYIDVDSKTQLERLKSREPAYKVEMFINKWIPLERLYFDTFKPKNICDEIITLD